jgi:PmbA protein
MNFIELCREAINAAVRAGAKEAEALVIHRHTVGAEIERAEIKTCTDVMDSGIGIRTVKNKKLGFAYTNILTNEEVKKTAKKAVKASNASRMDENWRQLPQRKDYPLVRDTYDKRVTQVTSDETVLLCQRMMAVAHEVDKRVLPAFGGVEVLVQEVVCLNTNGVEVKDKGTSLVYALGTMARSETQVSPVCYEFKASRRYEPDPEWVGREAGRLAIESINVGKAEAGKFSVLLDPFALESMLTYTLVQSVRGDIVSRGRSIFRDKIGKKVASENISIYDDGTLAGGLRSGKTDMEGVPRQKTPIIEDGILDGFLYNNYWAKLESKESTGNASRGGGGLRLPPYGTTPTIQPTNIILEARKATEDELIREVRNGYYVRFVQGAHQSNPETGEFSVALAPAWRIENGEITHAVKGVMIAGNAYDMIKKISLLGKETRQIQTLIAPKVVVSELKVVTK